MDDIPGSAMARQCQITAGERNGQSPLTASGRNAIPWLRAVQQ